MEPFPQLGFSDRPSLQLVPFARVLRYLLTLTSSSVLVLMAVSDLSLHTLRS